MRSIDGHVLMERLQEQTEVITNREMVAGLLMAQGVVLEAPTIDAVEVVRCKDCIFYEKALSVQGFCHAHGSIVSANAFCSYGSYGEHREDGEA